MSSVVDIRAYLAVGPAPTLVLLDLQRDETESSHWLEAEHRARALTNCRSALAHAREMGFPVAFVRRSPDLNAPATRARWIDRFEPRGSEMVFDRDKPSCFASALFADAIATSGGPIVLAGLSGETACLASAIDAFHRDHDFTFLSDASASHTVGDMAADQVHTLLTELIGRYGHVLQTQRWIRTTTAIQACE